MPPPFDAFARARSVAERARTDTGRLVSRLSAGGACHDAPTVYLPGCNLACVHCWAGPGRADPRGHGRAWSRAELRRGIARYRRHNRLGAAQDWIRLSGGEPILDAGFFELLEGLLALPGRVYVETNGVMLGARPDWIDRLAGLAERVHLNVSVKAGTPAQFARITGAAPAAWEATFDCLAGLVRAGLDFDLNALTREEELFTPTERRALLQRLAGIHPSLPDRLAEEGLTPYPHTVRRMEGVNKSTTSGRGSTRAGTSTSDPTCSGA